jgi:DNA polymerase I-like protein with 3'-5' exonuclease and polymerase domains
VPLIPVLSRIERNGVLVDAKRLHQHSVELGERMHALTQEALHSLDKNLISVHPNNWVKFCTANCNCPR